MWLVNLECVNNIIIDLDTIIVYITPESEWMKASSLENWQLKKNEKIKTSVHSILLMTIPQPTLYSDRSYSLYFHRVDV